MPLPGNLYAGRIAGGTDMKNDPIVTEVREIRQKLAARFNYDLKAIFDDARQRQSLSGKDVVNLDSRNPQNQIKRNEL